MSDDPVFSKPALLDDTQVQRFIRDGFISIQTDFSTPVHQDIYQRLEELTEKEGNVGNNILPRVPQIKRVFDHPALRGALTSLLGPGYMMNPHRHCHLNLPGTKGQQWHKDCYVFDHNMRQPRFRWILALYYPQEVTGDMGPTGILPGRHFYEGISDANADHTSEEAHDLCGPAGTVVLTDFNAWHRATANTSQAKRYMLKFQFTRMHEPVAPTWDHSSAGWSQPVDQDKQRTCLDVWNWLRGAELTRGQDKGDVESLVRVLAEGEEEARLAAAYQLGAIGSDAVAAVSKALYEEAVAVEPRIEAPTADNLHGTNPTALRAVQALIAMGPDGVPALHQALESKHWLVRAAAVEALGTAGAENAGSADTVEALQALAADSHWWVRRNVVEALGRIGTGDEATCTTLIEGLADEDRRVRRMAALALAQIWDGKTVVPEKASAAAVGALKPVLEDEDRYNRHYATMALSRIPGEAAHDTLMDFLLSSRWCPLTTTESRY
jgi:HEAT repeat protein